MTLLVALFARRVIRVLDPGDGTREEWGGLLAGAIFAAHPLASEVALMAVGRSELLAAGFGLAGFLALPSLAGATVLFFLAMCAKESAAAWVVIVPLYLGTLVWKRGTRPGARELRFAAPPALALVAFLLLRQVALEGTAVAVPWIDNPLVRVDAVTRIANAVVIQARYVLTMLLPARLSIEHGFDQIPVRSLLPWGALAALAILALFCGIVALVAKRSYAGAFFLVFIPAAFVVTGNVLLPIGTIFGERLAYLPLAGFCGLAGLGLASVPWRLSGKLAVAGVLVVALGARTAVRARDFQSLAALNEATAAASPRAVKALANQGRTLLRTGRAREAIDPLERAVGIWPDYSRALDLLSQAHAALGEGARAAEYRRRAEEAAKRIEVPADE